MAASFRPGWRVLVVSTVLALLAAAGTVVLLSGDEGSGDDGSTSVPLVPQDEVPPFDEATYTTFEGETLPVAGLQGTPTVLNFWASYCTPCLTEMPAFEEVYQEVPDGEVAFLGLAVADRTDDAVEMAATTGVTYPLGEDKDASVITAADGTVLPWTVLLDADGQIVASHAGEMSADQLRQLLRDELGIET